MRIKKAELLAVAVKKEQYPIENVPEVAFCGRSNVGKSSLLNLLTNRKKLARISNSPGKTRTINFYSINDDMLRIVDLPGYGYAKLSKSVSEKWGEMIENYLKNRKTLKKVIILVDIRHEPSEQDVQMYEFLRYYKLDGVVVLTKADKISRNDIFKQKRIISKKLGLGDSDLIVPISSLKRTGVDELMQIIENLVFGKE